MKFKKINGDLNLYSQILNMIKLSDYIDYLMADNNFLIHF